MNQHAAPTPDDSPAGGAGARVDAERFRASQGPRPSVQEQEERPWAAAPVLVALAGWLLPGLGYWLIGRKARATISGLTILLTFAAGIFIGGIRVVDVPGYREAGQRMVSRDGRWALVAQPMPTVLEKPWYMGQILTGPVAVVASYFSLEAARQQIPKGTAHVAEFGTLYCAVAGMLNLLVIIDSTARAAGHGKEGTQG